MRLVKERRSLLTPRQPTAIPAQGSACTRLRPPIAGSPRKVATPPASWLRLSSDLSVGLEIRTDLIFDLRSSPRSEHVSSHHVSFSRSPVEILGVSALDGPGDDARPSPKSASCAPCSRPCRPLLEVVSTHGAASSTSRTAAARRIESVERLVHDVGASRRAAMSTSVRPIARACSALDRGDQDDRVHHELRPGSARGAGPRPRPRSGQSRLPHGPRRGSAERRSEGCPMPSVHLGRRKPLSTTLSAARKAPASWMPPPAQPQRPGRQRRHRRDGAVGELHRRRVLRDSVAGKYHGPGPYVHP